MFCNKDAIQINCWIFQYGILSFVAFNLVAKSKYKLSNNEMVSKLYAMFDARIIFPNRINIYPGNMSFSTAGSM